MAIEGTFVLWVLGYESVGNEKGEVHVRDE